MSGEVRGFEWFADVHINVGIFAAYARIIPTLFPTWFMSKRLADP